jgi:hypothetical protein
MDESNRVDDATVADQNTHEPNQLNDGTVVEPKKGPSVVTTGLMTYIRSYPRKLEVLGLLVAIISVWFLYAQIGKNTDTNKVELRGQLYDRQMRLANDMGAGDAVSTLWALAPKEVTTDEYGRTFLRLVTKDSAAINAKNAAELYHAMFDVGVFDIQSHQNGGTRESTKAVATRSDDTKTLRALYLYTQNTFYHVHNIFDYQREEIVSEAEWRVWKGLLREMHAHPMLLTVIWQGYQNHYFSRRFAQFLQEELNPDAIPPDVMDEEEFRRSREFLRAFYPEMTSKQWPDRLPDY